MGIQEGFMEKSKILNYYILGIHTILWKYYTFLECWHHSPWFTNVNVNTELSTIFNFLFEILARLTLN